MKRISQISIAVVFAAALATGALAANRGDNGSRSAPAPAVHDSAPAPAPAVHYSAPTPAAHYSAPAPAVHYSAPAPSVQSSPIARLSQTAPQQRVQATGGWGQGTAQFTQPMQNQRETSPSQIRITPSVPARQVSPPTTGNNDRSRVSTTGNQSNQGTRGNGFTQGNKGNSGNNKGTGTTKKVTYPLLGTNKNGYKTMQNNSNNKDHAWHYGHYSNSGGHGFVRSPWGLYPSLPGYVDLGAVVVDTGIYLNWDAGTVYDLNPYANVANTSLNDAVSEINSIFQYENVADVQDLVNPGTQIAIFSNGQYQYSIGGSDFQQMMDDNAQNVQTVSFQVTTARLDGAYAIIDATHSFIDPNGNTDTVYQEYRLQNIGGRYVIVDFSTSQAPL